jgi:DNA-binding response OmpR family regulator
MGRILIIDDDPEIRDAIRRLLEAEGHEVLYSEDGPSILDQVAQQRSDTLLLDLEMPEIGGLEVLSMIRQDSLVMTTSVIIVSVRGRPSDRDRAEELDVTDYILKPWQDGEIEMRVKFAMSSVGKTRDIVGPNASAISVAAAAPSADPDLSMFLDDDDDDDGEVPPPAEAAPEPPAPEPAIEGESSSGRGVFIPTKKDTGEKKVIDFKPSGKFKVPDIVPVAIIPPPQDPETALILIVEDEECARLPLVDCMQRAGFRTIEESDGGSVEKMVIEHKPDVVLLDLTLPRLNGIQVLRSIKGNGEIRKTSVIMVTGDTDRDIIENCISIGARDFVPKPWHAGDIQHGVKRQLSLQERSPPRLSMHINGPWPAWRRQEEAQADRLNPPRVDFHRG